MPPAIITPDVLGEVKPLMQKCLNLPRSLFSEVREILREQHAIADRKERERIARRASAKYRREYNVQVQAWWQEATKGGAQPPSLDNPPPGVRNRAARDADA